MTKSEILTKQNGCGDLVLKTGTRQQVTWEIELLSDGSFGNGSIRGEDKHLATAAKDGCANLHLSFDITAAIAIDSYKDGEALFATLLVSRSPSVFRAQTINGSSPVLDGRLFSIEFANREGEQFLVTVPTITIQDYLPILQKSVPPRSPASRQTVFIRRPNKWRTATPAMNPFVCLIFDDEPPVGLVPEDARELAAKLIELAEVVETRGEFGHSRMS